MIPQQWKRYFIIVASILVALILSVYPLPLGIRWWRPEFVLLVAIYWMSAFPETISLLFLCVVGLFQDLLEAVPLGQHGLSLVIVAYICIQSHQRVSNFSVWKEAGWIFVLVGVQQLASNWVQSLTARPLSGLIFLGPAFTSALVWPFFRIGLDKVSGHYRIN